MDSRRRKRGIIRMAPPPPPELMDDIVPEILLRLPPDDPACLVRASLVCKHWRRVLSDPAFPCRYGEFHRTPPLLGILRGPYHSEARFVPVTAKGAPPLLQPEFQHETLDCRHGRVLLETKGNLAVWDPITGDHHKVLPSMPPAQPIRSYFHASLFHTGAVLCAVAGCDHHRGCHHDGRGPFLVVFVTSTGKQASAWVYSSEAAAWSEPAPVQLEIGQERPFFMFSGGRRAAIVGDEIYFLLAMKALILKYDLGKHCLSVIDSPCKYTGPAVLMAMEDGSLGLAGVQGNSTLHLWSRKVDDPMRVTRWVQYRVIDLKNLLPVSIHRYNYANVIGFAEGVDVLFVRAVRATFMIELRSGRVIREVDHPGCYFELLPFMRFYIPDFRLAITNPTEEQTSRADSRRISKRTKGASGLPSNTHRHGKRKSEIRRISKRKGRKLPRLNRWSRLLCYQF